MAGEWEFVKLRYLYNWEDDGWQWWLERKVMGGKITAITACRNAHPRLIFYMTVQLFIEYFLY